MDVQAESLLGAHLFLNSFHWQDNIQDILTTLHQMILQKKLNVVLKVPKLLQDNEIALSKTVWSASLLFAV